MRIGVCSGLLHALNALTVLGVLVSAMEHSEGLTVLLPIHVSAWVAANVYEEVVY